MLAELFLDGADAGIDINDAIRRINSFSPMTRAGARWLTDWALTMVRYGLGFKVTGTGSVPQQAGGELERARLALENTQGWIDEETDPVSDNFRRDVYSAVTAGIIAYNKVAQAAVDSKMADAKLKDDLRNIPRDALRLAADISGEAGQAAADIFGSTVSGLAFGNLTTFLLLGAVGYGAYLWLTDGGGGRAVAGALNRKLR